MSDGQTKQDGSGAVLSTSLSKALLASARVGVDPCRERGRVCRGAYIVSDPEPGLGGRYYLTHDGEWTFGIRGDKNWWNTQYDAEQALKAFRKANH